MHEKTDAVPGSGETVQTGVFLLATGVFKQFGGVTVLENVDLDVNYGEVHALMGENGAGKSTIIKIITGVYTKDAGEIFIDGRHAEINSRQDARALGISVIYQELSLIPALTVTENIFLGLEKTKYGLLDKKSMHERVRSLVDHYGFDIDPDATVDTMGMAQRQMAEILKALAFKAKLIIMDEPTSSLSAAESEKLFETIDGLRRKGVGILYVSHRLEEVYRLSDRLTVMRDGKIVGVLKKEEIESHKVMTMMIGREVKGDEEKGSTKRYEDRCLEVKNLAYGSMLKDVSFRAYGGEILGIGGLVGSGRTELIRCIYGAAKYSEGTITLNGKPVSRSIRKNIKNGFGYVPEDRRVEGLIPLLTTEKNITIASYDKIASAGLVNRKKETDWADRAISDYDIRPPIRTLPGGNLSGGNQQKTILSRWLTRDPQILLLDEPTVGVDVGVKIDLYKLLRELAEKGTIVIMVSSDLPELVFLADRILVMHGGKFFEEFERGRATQSAVLLAASGVHTEEGKAL
ncbi:MAG: sugar ABC transporter ATP-binding protein [Oscillospiraceae bacterium]|nr:sugar ABC transporter ATP-binding protein [Oscillospiraceae bacterium]